MTRQELLKQADYTFQRGNRELAKKYLSEYLASYPDDEAAWMLMARITGEKAHQIACYERVLKINPGNNEAKIGLARIQAAINPTLPRANVNLWQPKKSPYRNALRGALITLLAVLLFGTTGLVVAQNNPSSKMAQWLAIVTPTVQADTALANEIAPQTLAEVNEKYPQYTALVNALIGFAVNNAATGMEGAPERPGDEIIISEQSGMEAKALLENSLPQPGSLTSLTITEQQLTSWLAMELLESPDLPLSQPQVYLRDGKIQVWGVVTGSGDSTAALIVGELKIDGDKKPYFEIESMQIGQQVIPDLILSQMETWLNQMLLESINEQAPGLQVMNIKVTSGLITISGMR
ncbi:MAG: hypothetical protein DPW18_02535 [Chloroflexi bacterium]|nr:hypothetical protein [Chloroflexota bacterium]MDL1942728.1 hypothetical protein [Chloroflexi bacterium CFX2]